MSRVKLLIALVVALGLSSPEVFAQSFYPDNTTPVDWNTTATWKQADGTPAVGVPGFSAGQDVKIGSPVPGGIVTSTTDVDVTLNGKAGINNVINDLFIGHTSTQPNSTKLEIASTSPGTLRVNGSIRLGYNGVGTATLLQSGGDVDYFDSGNPPADSAFSVDGANAIAEFAGGTAIIGRFKIGASTGASAHGGNNVVKVSGAHVLMGDGVFSDTRLYRESSLLVTDGILDGLGTANIATQVLDYSAPGVRAIFDISGGEVRGFESLRGPNVTVSGGKYVVGTDPTNPASTFERTSLEDFNSTTASFAMTSGETVFNVLSNGSIAEFKLTNSALDLTGGTVVVDFTNYAPSAGNSFDLINENTGTFNVVDTNISPAPAGLLWDTSQWQSDGILALTAIPEPSTLLLTLLSIGGLAITRRRR